MLDVTRRTIAILGGSSAFTPLVADAVANRASDFPEMEIRLFGRSQSRLECVARFCNMIGKAGGGRHRYQWTTSIVEAVADAEIIINQIRFGGFAGRHRDETFPLEFGLPGDETIGPGGLASALRSLGPASDFARVARRHARPDAWFINMTNPMPAVIGAVTEEFGSKTIGLCELPGDTVRRACALVGAALEDVDYEYVGFNHQGWILNLRTGRAPLLPAFFGRMAESPSAQWFGVDAAEMRRWDAIPLHYFKYYMHTKREVARQRAAANSRAAFLSELSDDLYQIYASAESPELPAELRSRQAPWVRDALVPALAALLMPNVRPSVDLFITTRNHDAIPDLPSRASVERRATIVDGEVVFSSSRVTESDRARFVPFLLRLAHYEEATAQAARECDEESVEAALDAHPLTAGRGSNLGLARATLAAAFGDRADATRASRR